MIEFVKKMRPLHLAILIDLLMILPYIDVLICIPLQHLLWGKDMLDKPEFAYANHAYCFADYIIPFFGDLFPLNTTCVLYLQVTGKIGK